MTTDRFLEAESSVAGSILIDSRCLPAVAGLLTEEDFVSAQARAIFRAAMSLFRENGVVDPVTIRVEAERAGCALSDALLMQLMELTPTAANVEEYARLVREGSMRRELRTLAASLDVRASGPDDPREMIGAATAELERIESRDTANELATSSETMLRFYDHRERMETEAGGGFVPTGLKSLDQLLGGGMLCSGLYVLAARPGMGKTSAAINIMENIAAKGAVLFVSLEMDLEQVAAKRLARATGIPSDKLMMGTLTDEEYKRVTVSGAALGKRPVYLNRKPGATVQEISNMARRVKGLRCIVVDYIGKISPGERGKKASRYEYMTEISGELKTLARTFKVPVLALAQLNRENTNRSNRRPQLSDLRDTGAIEQDADGVIFLHRPDYYEEKAEGRLQTWEPVPVEVILEKNRHSGTGKCDMPFYMATCRFAPTGRVEK